jgi:hypothetical protein
MRAREFILLEYRRDITIQKMGDRLFDAFLRAKPGYVPPSLDLIHRGFTTGDKYPNVAAVKPKVIERLVQEFESADPTANKEYTQWMIRSFINNPDDTRFEDYNRGGLLELFHRAKQRGVFKRPGHVNVGRGVDADINSYKTYSEFYHTMMDYYKDELNKGLEDEESTERGQFREVYDDDQVRVVQPLNQDAACYYGRGTMWCTASTRGTNYFDHYNRQGPLYILLPKRPRHEGEKFQIHPVSGQFKDENDDDVSLTADLIPRFKGFFETVKDQHEFRALIAFARDELLTRIFGIIGELALDLVWEKVSEMEGNDDGYRDWQEYLARERGYIINQEDPDDPESGEVDWDRVHEDDQLNDYLDYNDEARTLIDSVKEINGSSAQQIREYVRQHSQDDDDERVTNLDYIYDYALDKESGYGRRDWQRDFLSDIGGIITSRVYIVRKEGSHRRPQAEMISQTIDAGDGWEVIVNKPKVYKNMPR